MLRCSKRKTALQHWKSCVARKRRFPAAFVQISGAPCLRTCWFPTVWGFSGICIERVVPREGGFGRCSPLPKFSPRKSFPCRALRGPVAILFISRNTCSDSIAKLFCACFLGYRTVIARYVAKWVIAQMCLCDTKYQGVGGIAQFGWAANVPENVSCDMGYRSDSIAISRDMGPLRQCYPGTRKLWFWILNHYWAAKNWNEGTLHRTALLHSIFERGGGGI